MRPHSGYFQINQSRGALSYFSLRLSLMILQKLYVNGVLNQPLSKKPDYRKEQS